MNSCYLSAFALIEPQDRFHLYYPSWLNVWESHLYNLAIKTTHAQGWLFKRFGCDSQLYAREMIRKPDYLPCLEAIDQAADQALAQLAAKERMRLMKSRTALIYVDAWGEPGLFENVTSALHVTMLDSLPKSVLKKFAVKGFSCKVRGEQHALMQALSMTQDYLNWDLFDFVVICAVYRAIPLLVFSAAQSAHNTRQAIHMNISVERTGCFIFSQRASPFQVACGSYLLPPANAVAREKLYGDSARIAVAGLQPPLPASRPTSEIISLSEKYGDSGCLSPALSWVYLARHAAAGGTMRTVMPDASGSYHYFDTRYQP